MNKHINLIQALAFVMTLLSIPTLATAASPTINILNGELLAKGVGVLVTFEITCDPGSLEYAYVNANITQRTSKSVVKGYGGSSIDPALCDGTPHTVETIVQADDWSNNTVRLFKRGVALAWAQIGACYDDGSEYGICYYGNDNGEIRIEDNKK